MAKQVIWQPGTTYKDWLLRPDRVRKDVTVDTIDLRAPLTSYNSPFEIKADILPEGVFVINTPLISAPMQAVTGPKMAIELAKTGGLGAIYCSQPTDDQAQMVAEVKRHRAGFVTPDVFSPRSRIDKIADYAKQRGYSTFPITHNGKPNGRLLGLLTNNDYDERVHGDMTAYGRMTGIRKLTFAYEDEIEGDLKKANKRLQDSHHGSIPIIDRKGRLKAMVFKKDIRQHRENPLALVDDQKRYKVGAAINTHDYAKRVPKLVEAGADILFIDSSNGYSDHQLDTIEWLKRKYPDVPFIGGNIATSEGFEFLANAGADGVKIGMGPGSICTTREKFRIGVAQATAVYEVDQARQKFLKDTGRYVPIIADGGIITNDDVWVALALGADSVMAGSFFAQFEESPPEVKRTRKTFEGRPFTSTEKPYWGEGSERAQRWRQERYSQSEESEGTEGTVPYGGRLGDVMPRAVRSIKIALQKVGYANIKDLHEYSTLRLESASSRAEGKPHDIGAIEQIKLW